MSGDAVRCHRMVSLLVAMFAAVVMAPAAAHAEPYPAETPPASVSDGTVEPGGTVTFSGSGMKPYEEVSIEINYSGSDSGAAYRPQRASGFVLAAKRLTITTTADGNGNFSVEVPLTQVGTATLVATGLESGTTVTTTVEVAPDADSGDDGDTDDGDDNGGGGGGDDSDDSDDVSLPTTGPSSTPLLVAAGTGVGAILLGTGLLLLTRSRRRDTTS